MRLANGSDLAENDFPVVPPGKSCLTFAFYLTFVAVDIFRLGLRHLNLTAEVFLHTYTVCIRRSSNIMGQTPAIFCFSR